MNSAGYCLVIQSLEQVVVHKNLFKVIINRNGNTVEQALQIKDTEKTLDKNSELFNPFCNFKKKRTI